MLLLTAVGPDRPGMAHAVANVLFASDCNIEDTTMTRLSGQFAMILVVSPPPAVSVEALGTKLEGLRDSHGLTIELSPIEPETASGATSGTRLMVSLYGPEAKGLLARITGVLAAHAANITDVQTRVASRGTVYVMLLEVELPEGADSASLEADLVRAARAAGLELSVHPLEEDTL